MAIRLMQKVCPVCGENFIPAAYHHYKIKTTYYCRYNCYMKQLKINEAEKKQKK